MNSSPSRPLIAIACGGTGGHLFPGLTVADELSRRQCDVSLLVSPKEVDQKAVNAAAGLSVYTLPAVGLSRGRVLGFMAGFAKSLWASKALFHRRPPQAVLAMGGFTGAPPVLAGKACGALTFLHESNTIPGRANRWLAHVVDQAFVGFPSAADRLRHPNVLCTGTPVRPQLQPGAASASRQALGLDADKPVLLVMGGSQGATAINELILQALPELARAEPDLQLLQLTGTRDFERVKSAYAGWAGRAVVRPFLTEMQLAMSAATLTVSRAGASSLAELAAMRLPAILIPFPSAADDHQWHNARAFADVGAALLLEQKQATAARLVELVRKLLRDPAARTAMRDELVRWHKPHAAEVIAEKMVWLMKTRGLGQGVVDEAPRAQPERTAPNSATPSRALAGGGVSKAGSLKP